MIEPQPRLGDHEAGGARFWGAALVGLGVVAFGLRGLLQSDVVGSAWSWARAVVVGLIVHDGVIAPVVGLTSVVLLYLVGTRARPVVQGTLIVLASTIVVAIPALTGEGRNPRNTSILPHDYAGNLALICGLIVLAGLGCLALRLRRRSAPAPQQPARGGW